MFLLRTGLGVGDVLLATGVLEALARTHRKKFIVETRYPELFLHNPHVAAIWPAGRAARLIKTAFDRPFVWRIGSAINAWLDRRSVGVSYPFPCRNRHLIDAMAESAGVQLLPHERRPFIYLTKEEIEAQSWAKGWIAVQSSSSTYWTPNKNWVSGRMQLVVDELRRNGYEIVHLGNVADESLVWVKDLRGKVGPREGAAILGNCRLMICLEGGLAHSAKAVGTPAVVLYTGYTDVHETGYPDFINLRPAEAGESCWRRDLCEHCRRAAEAIGVDEVLYAAFTQLRIEVKPSSKVVTL